MGDAGIERVGRYELLAPLAVGGMAEVFRARALSTVDSAFSRPVAFKRLLQHLADDERHVAMFLDEARLAARLDHSNLVPALDVGIENGIPYQVLALVEGLDLRQLAAECARTGMRMPAQLVALIGRELLDALEYAHELRDSRGRHLHVIHRDISPGNVLVSWRGDVRLIDFGIARSTGRRSRTCAGQLKGKVGYMAPEQLLGLDVDGRADLFSVGVVLSELLVARRLFTGGNELDVMRMVRDARIDSFLDNAAGLSPTIVATVTHALQRLPDDRFLFARQFRDALDRELWRGAPTTRADLAAFVAAVKAAPTVARQPRQRTSAATVPLAFERARAAADHALS